MKHVRVQSIAIPSAAGVQALQCAKNVCTKCICYFKLKNAINYFIYCKYFDQIYMQECVFKTYSLKTLRNKYGKKNLELLFFLIYTNVLFLCY
jgi:hypothetical protein